MIETADLKIIACKMLHLTKKQAQGFYAVHKDKPFFDALTDFMSSGSVVVSVLEGLDAVTRYRNLMGATDSQKAVPNTIRATHGTDMQQNAVHGSDSPENAAIEISFFFSSCELC
jgi:nucleoside-diphosphate kinase